MPEHAEQRRQKMRCTFSSMLLCWWRLLEGVGGVLYIKFHFTLAWHGRNKEEEKGEKFYWQRRRRRNFIALLFAWRFNQYSVAQLIFRGEIKRRRRRRPNGSTIFHPAKVVDSYMPKLKTRKKWKVPRITFWSKVFETSSQLQQLDLYFLYSLPPTRALFYDDTPTTGIKEERKFWAQFGSRERVLGYRCNEKSERSTVLFLI